DLGKQFVRKGVGVTSKRRGFAQRRKAVGYTQESFAESLGVERTTVARWEAGDAKPQPCIRPKIARALQVSIDQLDRLLTEANEPEPAQEEQAYALEQPANADYTDPVDERGDQIEEDATKRRQVIGFAGTALALALWPDFADAVGGSQDEGRRGRIDKTLVGAHQEISQTLAGLYRSGDPRLSFGIITAYSDELLDLLDAPMSDVDRITLHRVAVGVHAQAGLWACHMNRPSVAYRYLATSREVAAASGDPALHARALGALSYLFSSAPRGGRGGDPRRCLRLLGEAIDLASRADPFTLGWLSIWRADQHATLGNLAAARADAEAAEHALNCADHGQLEGFFSRSTYGYGMDGHLIRLKTMIHALNGGRMNLDQSFSEVMSSTANLRHQVCALANLAMVGVAVDEPECCCDVLNRSVRLAAKGHYTMGLLRAIGVRNRFDPRWATIPSVIELDDQIRHLRII
ncbi:MAG TPA: helix-turn-helix transcriptional regulator, partial [Pseudonocardiaceae bacterium]|nr:helix-turn-helix transcriptional regulator [Pseudonocardiaceae bacterium]